MLLGEKACMFFCWTATEFEISSGVCVCVDRTHTTESAQQDLQSHHSGSYKLQLPRMMSELHARLFYTNPITRTLIAMYMLSYFTLN